jgi:hypothetical protein
MQRRTLGNDMSLIFNRYLLNESISDCCSGPILPESIRTTPALRRAGEAGKIACSPNGLLLYNVLLMNAVA